MAGARGIEPLAAGLESAVLPLHQAPEKEKAVSAHYKAELRIKTAGETDDEEERIELFLKHVRELALTWNTVHRDAGTGIEIELGDLERN